MTDQLADWQRQFAVTFMTTEQFTLQTARSTTTAEAHGRATLFLSTLSSALVALGIVAQTSAFGQPFGIFARLVLPPIAFLGIIPSSAPSRPGWETYSTPRRWSASGACPSSWFRNCVPVSRCPRGSQA